MNKIMLKLTDAGTLDKVYICTDSIDYMKMNYDYNWTDHKGNSKSGGTEIRVNGSLLYVVEHIAEILAIIEGRNPTPAKIMFGNKDG